MTTKVPFLVYCRAPNHNLCPDQHVCNLGVGSESHKDPHSSGIHRGALCCKPYSGTSLNQASRGHNLERAPRILNVDRSVGK